MMTRSSTAGEEEQSELARRGILRVVQPTGDGLQPTRDGLEQLLCVKINKPRSSPLNAHTTLNHLKGQNHDPVSLLVKRRFLLFGHGSTGSTQGGLSPGGAS